MSFELATDVPLLIFMSACAAFLVAVLVGVYVDFGLKKDFGSTIAIVSIPVIIIGSLVVGAAVVPDYDSELRAALKDTYNLKVTDTSLMTLQGADSEDQVSLMVETSDGLKELPVLVTKEDGVWTLYTLKDGEAHEFEAIKDTSDSAWDAKFGADA